MNESQLTYVQDPRRLAALDLTGLLDSHPEEEFDRFTKLAARMLGVAASLVTLVDSNRQFFKSQVGDASPWSEKRESPLAYSFCQYVVQDRSPLSVEDARTHPLLSDNPAVHERGVVSYLGLPLRIRDGHVLGSFCVLDTESRTWTPMEVATLEDIASAVNSEIRLRLELAEKTALNEQLSLAQQRYSALACQSKNFVWEIGPEGLLTEVNQVVTEKLKLGPGDSPSFLQPELVRTLVHLGENLQPVDHECVLSDGTNVWLETTAISFKQGGALGISRDITEQKFRAQMLEAEVERRTEELRNALAKAVASEERFSILLERTPQAIAMVDRNLRYLAHSRRFVEDYRLPYTTLVGESHLDVFPETPDRWKEHLQNALQGQPSKNEEDCFVRSDGRREWVRWELVPWYNSLGEVGGLILFTEVLTERRNEQAIQVEQNLELLSLTKQLRQAQKAAKIIYWSCNYLTGRLSLLGFADDSPFTLDLDEFLESVRTEDRTELRKLLRSDSPAPGLLSFEYHLLDGKVMQGLGSVEGDTADGIIQDVTEMRQLEEKLRHSQKMEAVGVLAGGIAHDFNNILVGILLPAELALETLGPDHEASPDLEEILLAGARAKSLVRQLLLFSHKKKLTPRLVCVNQALREFRSFLDRLLPANVGLKLSLCEDEGSFVKIDPNVLEQVIMNLVVNSRDALPRGGEIIVDTLSGPLPAQRKSHGQSLDAGNYVILTVGDNGSGIPPEAFDRIFEAFFTTKGIGKGTGLGLSVCFEIIQGAGGVVDVKSGPDRGTRFSVYLPQVVEVDAQASKEMSRDLLPGGKETIVLVDDDVTLRNVVGRILISLGYEVHSFPDAETALVYVKENPIDLLLTDLALPGMDGRELVAETRHYRSDALVLLMTGFAPEMRRSGETLGIHHRLLDKPFSRGVLALAVRETLDSREAALQ